MRKYFVWAVPIFFIAAAFGWLQQIDIIWKLGLLFGFSSIAIGAGHLKVLSGYQYTFWIITAVCAGLLYPEFFLHVGSFDMRNKWLILIIIQMVMFGMGTQMSIEDFTGIRKSGKGVLIGLLGHFTIMPIMGFLIAKTFGFEPEIAAGIILIGSCSSGLASNVMTYIAKGNLVLSVTVTAMSTLAAPIMTPFLMKIFAGTMVEVHFFNMMMEIIKIVLVPLAAAMIHDILKNYGNLAKKRIYILTILSAAWLAIVLFFGNSFAIAEDSTASHILEIINFTCGAFIVGTLYHLLYKVYPKIDAIMPYFSMFGIIYFTLVTTAAGRDNLIQIGFLLFLASVLHNGAGYFFGYWLSRLSGLDKKSSQTIAFEVGLQNGGMASGLAGSMGKLATLGLASAVFSPWMNVSGSLLANYWRKKGEEEEVIS
ncbi:BASS family bile acid:Na+ symporter [Flavobacterium nitrogenifigens]|uniref:BASS family bile acid:Na+ symporter n=2 Tax=Flavobacterium TaxID=237 RepID=A0A7W7N8B2_9FLAO|nr:MULTISPECIES: bile acid:sodium symporter family protein [Flavobacterium]MBB4802202.1 BASS family bile acid:Na+ symporter [Flavobacterium nitrogenifigens]MBB6387160.1 BASS family bile acid:Na+ symporter [Flavobacterium notoginsengisoli]